jgi:hypothetical protein
VRLRLGAKETSIIMANQLYVDAGELVKLATVCDRAAVALADAVMAAQDVMALPRRAFGNTTGGSGLYDAWTTVSEDAVLPVDELVSVLEIDYDRLLQVAAAFEAADDSAKAALRSCVETPGPRQQRRTPTPSRTGRGDGRRGF